MIAVAMVLLAVVPEERTDRVPVDLRLDVHTVTRTQYVRDMLEDTRAQFAAGQLRQIRGRFPEEGPASPLSMRWSQYVERFHALTLEFTVDRVRPTGRDRAVSIRWTRRWQDGDNGPQRDENGTATVNFVWDGREYHIAGITGENPFEIPAPGNATDLVLGQVILPRDAAAGRTLTCRIGVENDGDEPVSGVRVEIREGRRTLASGEVDVPAGETEQLDLEFETTVDARDVLVVVDPADAVPERDEDNNARRMALRRGSQTDLILRSLRYLGDADARRPGGTLLYEVEVENRGEEEFARVRVEVREGRDTLASRDVRLDSRTTERVEIEFALQGDAAARDLVFVVDPQDDIEETDERNNERRETVRLEGARPDLIVVPGSVRVAGGRVYAMVRNAGSETAGAFTVRLNFRNHAAVDEPVPGLDAGEERRMIFTIPASAATTGIAVTPTELVLDPDNRIREEDEQNNRSEVR